MVYIISKYCSKRYTKRTKHDKISNDLLCIVANDKGKCIVIDLSFAAGEDAASMDIAYTDVTSVTGYFYKSITNIIIIVKVHGYNV